MKTAFVSVIWFIVCFSSLACAGEYVLIKGQGVNVCEAYLKNLNSFKTNWPMEYRKLNTEMKDFSKTDWVELADIRNIIPDDSNIEMHISEFIWKRDVNPLYYSDIDISKWHGTKKQLADAYKRFIYFRHEISPWKVPNSHLVANIDIDNDGLPEPVYQDCMYSNKTILLVLNTDYSDIDYNKTKLVTMHPSRKDLGLGYIRPVEKDDRGILPREKKLGYVAAVDALHAVRYSVFRYKGKTYFDLWGFPDNYATGWVSELDNYLKIYFAEKGSTCEICKYKYELSK